MALPALPVLAGILALAVVDAQPTPAPKPCSPPAHRQFDFWLGDWEVTQAGKIAGTNRITQILGGCALREEWKGAGGLSGTSLNMWDSASKKWLQTWVDGQGNVLLLEGGRQAEKMVLEGQSPDGKGGAVRNRISWSPLPAGHVRQLWETSADGGKTWTTAFDGDYAPRKP
jgi:hypothetical protein